MATIDAQTVENVVRRVLAQAVPPQQPGPVPVGVSARHVHLCRAHMDALFGPGSQLTPIKQLMGGQYAAEQQVTLVGPGLRSLEKVRVLGPLRGESQVEISRTDTFVLKVKAPVRPSGSTSGTPGITLVGPAGSVTLCKGCIIANRHIHMPPRVAAQYGLADNDKVDCLLEGERKTLFYGVQVRVDESFTLEMHIDTDDANAVGFTSAPAARIIKK